MQPEAAEFGCVELDCRDIAGECEGFNNRKQIWQPINMHRSDIML